MTIAEQMKTREQRIQEERERDEYYSRTGDQAPVCGPGSLKDWPPNR